MPIFLLRDRIIDPYIQCFFYCSTEVLVIPPNYIEVVNRDLVTTDVAVVKDWGGCLLMFFEPLCKGSGGFTNVLLITVNPATLKSIDDPTLFQDRIFILRGHQEAFDGSTSFKIHLYTMLVTGVFETFTDTFMIGHHHVGLWT